jgi:MFS family permease
MKTSRDRQRLLVLVTLNALATGLITFALPWIALESGRPVSEAALLVVIFDVAYTATIALAGPAGEHLGHRRTLRATMFADTVFALLVLVAVMTGRNALPLLVCLSIVLGAGTSFVITGAYAATAVVAGRESMTLAFAHLTVGRQIGVFGGPAAGAVVYAVGGVHALVIGVAAVCAAALLMAATLTSPYRTTSSETRVAWHRQIRSITASRQFRLLLLAGFVWNLPAGAALTLAVPFMRAHLHLSSFSTGIVLGAGAVGSISVAPMMKVLGSRVELIRLCVMAMAIQAVLLIVVGAATNWILLAPVYGAMMMSNTTVAFSVLTARSQRVAVHQQATVIGIGMFVNLLGYTFGGGIGALLARSLSMPVVYLVLGVAMFAWAQLLGGLFRAESRARSVPAAASGDVPSF